MNGHAVPVLPGLFLGAAAPGRAAGPGGVTALLVVDSEAPGAEAVAGLEEVLHVDVLDQPESDLLSQLDASVAFIGRAREKGGAVLVRCQAGVSRSVAVVTAYLMKASNLPFEEAYAFIQTIKPDAKMNEGFEQQLKLYEQMGCEVDVTSAVYKQYRLQKITEKYSEPQDLPQEVFAVDPNNIQQTPNCEILYKCRKCRRHLFRSSSILPHNEGKGLAAFAHKRFSEPAPLHCSGRSSCTSYFVEPLQWMEPLLLGVMEGQLLCPKCTSKLGSFHWHEPWIATSEEDLVTNFDMSSGVDKNKRKGRRPHLTPLLNFLGLIFNIHFFEKFQVDIQTNLQRDLSQALQPANSRFTALTDCISNIADASNAVLQHVIKHEERLHQLELTMKTLLNNVEN